MFLHGPSWLHGLWKPHPALSRSGQPNAGQPGWLRGALVRQRGPRRMCACRLRPRGWALRGIVAGLQRYALAMTHGPAGPALAGLVQRGRGDLASLGQRSRGERCFPGLVCFTGSRCLPILLGVVAGLRPLGCSLRAREVRKGPECADASRAQCPIRRGSWANVHFSLGRRGVLLS